MDVEKRAEFTGNVATGHRLMQAFQLLLHLLDRDTEARDFSVNLGRRNRVVRDLERRM